MNNAHGLDLLLHQQNYLVLDGGVSSEIQSRGVAMHPCAWSAAAHWNHPDIVYQVHRDYIDAGAQIITTNTFHAARHILDTIDLGLKTKAINAQAVELARRARDESGLGDVLIAGAMSTVPALDNPTDVPRGKKAASNFREQAEILAESGVDIILCEMLMDSEAAQSLIEAALATALPVWAGVSASVDSHNIDELVAFRTSGKYQAMLDEPFEELVKTVSGTAISVMGVMHTKPPLMNKALEILRRHWSGTAMGYATVGHFSDDRWYFDDAESPTEYAEMAQRWMNNFQLQVIGGCCGTSISYTQCLHDWVK